jgi:predicted nucleic acid-binding Zn ribbon protein
LSDNEPVHLTTLREALDAYVKRAGIGRRLKQQNVLADWPEIVGPRIAGATTPLRVAEHGTLVVAVRTAAWMQELTLLSPEILRLLARRGAGIKHIRWVAV